MMAFVRWYSIDCRGMTLWHKWSVTADGPRTTCGKAISGNPQHWVNKPKVSDGRCSQCFALERRRRLAIAQNAQSAHTEER